MRTHDHRHTLVYRSSDAAEADGVDLVAQRAARTERRGALHARRREQLEERRAKLHVDLHRGDARAEDIVPGMIKIAPL